MALKLKITTTWTVCCNIRNDNAWKLVRGTKTHTARIWVTRSKENLTECVSFLTTAFHQHILFPLFLLWAHLHYPNPIRFYSYLFFVSISYALVPLPFKKKSTDQKNKIVSYIICKSVLWQLILKQRERQSFSLSPSPDRYKLPTTASISRSTISGKSLVHKARETRPVFERKGWGEGNICALSWNIQNGSLPPPLNFHKYSSQISHPLQYS